MYVSQSLAHPAPSEFCACSSTDLTHRHLAVGARDELHVRGALDLGVEGRRHLPLVELLEVDVAGGGYLCVCLGARVGITGTDGWMNRWLDIRSSRPSTAATHLPPWLKQNIQSTQPVCTHAPKELVPHDLPRALLPAPEAPRRVRLEEAEEEVAGGPGEVRGEGGADVDDAVEHVLAVLVVEGRAPVQHLVEEDAEAPPVVLFCVCMFDVCGNGGQTRDQPRRRSRPRVCVCVHKQASRRQAGRQAGRQARTSRRARRRACRGGARAPGTRRSRRRWWRPPGSARPAWRGRSPSARRGLFFVCVFGWWVVEVVRAVGRGRSTEQKAEGIDHKITHITKPNR